VDAIYLPSCLTATDVISLLCYKTSVEDFLSKIEWILKDLSQDAEIKLLSNGLYCKRVIGAEWPEMTSIKFPVCKLN